MLFAQQKITIIGTTANAKSASIDLTNKTLVGVFIVAAHTAILNVLATAPDGSDYAVKDKFGNAITIPATATGYYAIEPMFTAGIRFLVFQSAGTEAATRTIYPIFRQID